MVKLIVIEGSADEVAAVGIKMGLSKWHTSPKEEEKPPPKKAVADVEAPAKAAPAAEDKPQTSRRSRPRKPKDEPAPRTEAKPADVTAAEDAAATEAEASVDNAPPSGNGADSGPITAADLADARRLHHIADRIMGTGIKDVEEGLRIAEALKDQVPLLKRVKDLDKRFRAAWEVASS